MDNTTDPAPLMSDLYGLKELLVDMKRGLPDGENAEAEDVMKNNNGHLCWECGRNTIISAGWCATCGWEGPGKKTRLSPWTREREHAAAPTPADAEGYAPDAAPACWVRRSTGGAIDFAIVLWRDAERGWLLRLGPAHGCRVVEVRLSSVGGDGPLEDVLVAVDQMIIFYGYTLEPV